jgi:pyrroline-5-carboxylate reductase
MTKTLGKFAGRMLLVGCGNMAGAMLDRWLAAGLDPARVAIVDPVAAPREGTAHFTALADWRAAGQAADWIMLGMKPQQLGEVAGDLAAVAGGEVHLLSILAGVSLADLAVRFPEARAQVRILPNLAARIGAGVSAVTSTGDGDSAAIEALLKPLGEIVALPDDGMMDASKGGTTQAGLDILDEGGELVALMTNVLRAARDRGRELADIARGDD